FRNRLDAIVHFNALGPAEIERVVDKQIDELRAMVAPKGVTIELDLLARAWLAAEGFDRAFGARPMARLMERKVKKPLSEATMFGWWLVVSGWWSVAAGFSRPNCRCL